MNPNDVFGEALEQLGTLPKQMGQSAKAVPGTTVQGVTAQVTGKTPNPTPGNGQASQVPSADILQNQQESAKSVEKPDDLLEMFGKTDMSPEQLDAKKAQKQMEDQQNLNALRQRLHSEYYQKLTTPTPKPEDNERPAERVERMEMQDLQEEKKKEQTPIAVARARSSAENKVAGAG